MFTGSWTTFLEGGYLKILKTRKGPLLKAVTGIIHKEFGIII